MFTIKVLEDLESRYLWKDACSTYQDVENTGKKHKDICILFGGLCYQTLSSFAKEYGFDGGGKNNTKMAWYEEQLSKCPLKDRLRFLRNESLESISMTTPRCVREALVDAKNMDEVFVPATRKQDKGNADLFKVAVLKDLESWYKAEHDVVTTEKKPKGNCILFDGVYYQTLSSFAKENGFDSGGKNNVKMVWFKQQLSKLPLKDCLRFLCSDSLKSISRWAPKGLREGKVDVKNKSKLCVPATRKRKMGNAGLFKSSVLEC